MSFTDAMSDLLAFCDKHGASITHLYNDDGKYHIELDYESKGHDGCKCHKLDTFTEPDADGEVEITRGELKAGDTVIYYGIDKTMHGKFGTIENVHRGGFTVRMNIAGCIYDDVSISQLRRKVNGA